MVWIEWRTFASASLSADRPSFYGYNWRLMEQLSNTELNNDVYLLSRANQAPVNSTDTSSLLSPILPLCSFDSDLLPYQKQNECQEPPLTSDHSWGTAPVYVIPFSHTMLCCHVSHRSTLRRDDTVAM